MKLPLLAAALACVSLAALADEADVKKAVEAKLGKVEKLVKSPVAGLWEVTVDGQIFYSDDKGGYLISVSYTHLRVVLNCCERLMTHWIG